MTVSDNLDEVFSLALAAKRENRSVSIAYHGNIVDLLEAKLIAQDFPIDLCSATRLPATMPITAGTAP